MDSTYDLARLNHAVRDANPVNRVGGIGDCLE